ncbi:MAG: alpha/beta hydrolase [Myxococcales bacterium]|nr:alpha/beta hydrolase [Myxococcales bacterium]
MQRVEREWDRGGVVLRGDESEGDGPAVVFVHGWCCDRSFLAPQFDHFARRRRVVALDLRGHGRSDGVGTDCAIRDLADDVASVIEQCGLERPVLVGHSLGGVIALDVAVRRPELVGAIAMLDSIVAIPSHLDGLAQGLSLLLASPRFRETLVDFVDQWLLRPDSDRALRDRVVDVMANADPDVALQAWQSMVEYDDRGAIKACPVPILFMAAENTVSSLEELPDMHPDLELVYMRGVSHFHPLEAPEATNRHLEDFLDRLRSRR